MAAAAAAAWYEELREVKCLEESIHKKMASISRRLMMAKDLSEVEAAKLKEEHAFLRKHVVQLGLEVSPKPDFSCMTEAERAAAAERLRNDELHYARRLSQEGDPRGPGMEACARIVDFDPKQGGLYYSRYSRGNLSNLDLDEESPIGPMRYIDSPYKSESDYFWLCTAVNFLSVKIASSDVGFPIRVYGTIIVRDSIDVRFVYHFRRDSDNCQLINSEKDTYAIVPPKVKFFFWLALHGRLWTAERRRRHGLQQDGTCVLCDQSEETTNHLLCSCTVTRELWVRLLSPAGFLHLAPLQGSTLVDWWLQARVGMPADGRRAFDSLTLVTSWILWKERNKRTFEGLARSTAQLFRAVTDELEEYVAAGYHGLTPLLLAIGQ